MCGSNLGNNKYKYSSKLSPPLVASSPTVSLTSLDPQMAAVMSSIQLGLMSRVKMSPSPQEASVNYNSLPDAGQHDDQPLDLSRKPNKTSSNKAAASTNFASLSTPVTTTSTTNGFSSLQSLQQRFGGDYPLGLSHKSALQSYHCTSHALSLTNDTNMRPGIGKSKSDLRLDNLDKQDLARASDVSPMHKGGGSRHTSPMLPDESAAAEMGGKHTIHRCSCQKSFSTLYALSLHLQETGHTPGSSKSASLMDYPKLVRGQDMWLNQESEQTRRILRCMQCGESFKSLPLLTVHMMQTQHYTKIVTSDHGRRSHKCSTYCDRELDKECIFKCKVCHEAFTDMEGLANHMIVSGHHKKQSSRHIPSTADLPSDSSSSSIVRQGRRKRFLPDDIASAAISGTSASTVASLLEYRQKQAMSMMNGFHAEMKPRARSPEAQRLFPCDSCGKSVGPGDFDSHVRACLRHRAEVIDALKNKLAVEEALLSRSESKLLRSGFKLSSLSGQRENVSVIAGSRGKESFLSDDYEKNCEKNLDDNHMSFHSQIKSENENTCAGQKHNSGVVEQETLSKTGEPNAKTCDLTEVPLKTWHCSNGESRHVAVKEEDASPGSLNVKTSQLPVADVSCNNHQFAKRESPGQEIPQEGKSTLSPGVGEKRKLSEMDSEKEDCNSVRKKDRLGADFIQEFTGKPVDFTSSALHKLDMFSRGLTFSPPKRTISPESKSHSHQSSRASKKKESTSSITRSPQPVPASPLSQAKTEFWGTESSSSALEAMESFIHKSFSVKSDLRSSNLASMFSPFRNCFPLPGTLPGQSVMVPESSDRAFSHFAKFSKFFRMVPGIPQFPETVHSVDNKKLEGVQSQLPSPSLSEPRSVIPQDKSVFLNKKSTTNKPNNISPTIKVPVVKFASDAAPGNNHTHRFSESRNIDNASISRKYKYSNVNAVASLNSSIRNQIHSQDLPQSSDKRDAWIDDLGHSKLEDMMILQPDFDRSLDEPKRKRRSEGIFDQEDGKSKMRNIKLEDEFTDERDERHVNDETEGKMNEESSSSPEEAHKCHEKVEISQFILYDDNLKSESATVCMPEKLTDVTEEMSIDRMKHERANDSIKEGSKDSNVRDSSLKKKPICEELEAKNEKDMHENLLVTDGKVDSLDHHADKSIKEEAGDNNESWHSSKPSLNIRYNEEVDVQGRSEDAADDLPAFANRLSFLRKKSWFENVNRESDESNCNNCDGDIDTDDDDDVASGDDGDDAAIRSGLVIMKRNKERRKIRTREIDSIRGSLNTAEQLHTNSILHNQSEVVAVKVEDNAGDVDKEQKNNEPTCSEEYVEKTDSVKIMNSLRKQPHDLSDNVSNEEEKQECNLKKEESNQQERHKRYGSEFHFGRKCSTALKPSGKENEAAVDPNGELHVLKTPGSDSMDKSTKLPEDNPVFSQLASKNSGDGDKQEKKSALDSLSSFVYSQPLTSEHPLDSLHRLLSTNDLTHLTADPHKYLAVAPSKCLTVDISAPLNLTSKGGGVNASSGGCSSDENEESDPAATEGGASEGDLREYKCAACNRKFASKGSYRYHLSRCHLSSVKKYGIKEAFNMSPYVYLPLDHTAKFSKYYQLAHELANKGK
ncbi:unnamed protein product [Candidula unifasciata]|uniref:C2H2-type domain-containing protein n=1 Tax=Candidula unifasciata TaxID=100452 RepID=A0A8S3ZX29_9EUPU|nr:unnamed protein product [Candidula unifasciata]